MRKYWKVELTSGVIIIPPSDAPRRDQEAIRKYQVEAILARLDRSAAYKKHLAENPAESTIKRVLDGNGHDRTCSLVHHFNDALLDILSKKR